MFKRLVPTVFRVIWFTTLSILLSAQSTLSQDKPTLTVGEALNVLAGLRNLDGRQVVVKQSGVDTIVMLPWEFNSGALRLRVATNITTLAQNEKLVETARVAIIKEILKDLPPDKNGVEPTLIQPGTPERERFERQLLEVLSQPAQGAKDLARLKASELKLDKNEISVTTLAALAPVLDNDIPAK